MAGIFHICSKRSALTFKQATQHYKLHRTCYSLGMHGRPLSLFGSNSQDSKPNVSSSRDEDFCGSWTNLVSSSDEVLASLNNCDFKSNNSDSYSSCHVFKLKELKSLTGLHFSVGTFLQLSNSMSKRTYHTSGYRLKDESKIVKTIKALKRDKIKKETEKQAEVAGTIVEEDVKTTTTPSKEPKLIKSDQKPVSTAVVKKTLAQRVVHEVKHYYHGFRLLFIDIRVATRYCWQVLRGNSLTRRERRQLVRTTSDLFRLVPFSVFVIVPFMEFLLPVALKLFPTMLPSTFAEKNKEQEKIRKKLKVKLEMAKFLQDTLEETAITRKGAKGETVQEFTDFLERIRSTGEVTTNDEILKYSQLFEDEITLDNLNYRQLRALCKLLEIYVVDLSETVLRFQIDLKLRELETDDRMIQKEGIESLEIWELQEACRARGMRSLGLTELGLKAQLQQWLDLHLTSKIPTSLLLLSRTLYLPETVPTAQQLKATISELPETAAVEAKVKISEESGDRVDPKAKLETIQQEEEIILAEKEDLAKETLAKEEGRKKLAETEQAKAAEAINAEFAQSKEAVAADDSAEAIKPMVDEILTDKADLLENEIEAKVEQESDITPDDLSDIEDILESVAEERTAMRIEKEDLQELKQDVSEYIDTVEELKSVVVAEEGDALQLEESKAARHLRKTVNTMIVQMDAAVDDLLREKDELLENIETKEVKVKRNPTLKEDADLRQQVLEQISQHKDDLIGTNELLLALKRIQKIPDDAKLEKIFQVANALDTDHDGKIDISHALKVIELIGRENVNLTPPAMSKIIKLLQKEEYMEEILKERRMKEREAAKK